LLCIEWSVRTRIGKLYYAGDSKLHIASTHQTFGGLNLMAGILVFSSVNEALRAGFHVYDRTNCGYLVRFRTARGWALAVAHDGSPE
jgi:hypothetical protein